MLLADSQKAGKRAAVHTQGHQTGKGQDKSSASEAGGNADAAFNEQFKKAHMQVRQDCTAWATVCVAELLLAEPVVAGKLC